jgi:hypothetical protein
MGSKNLTKGTICEKLTIVTRYCLDPRKEGQTSKGVNGRSSVTIFGQGIVTPRIRRKVEKGRNYFRQQVESSIKRNTAMVGRT